MSVLPQIILSFAELWRSSGGFESVFLPLFHSRIPGQVAGFFENGPIVFIYLQQGSGDAVTDGTGLTGVSAAFDIDEDIVLSISACRYQRLPYDYFQSFKSEIIINISFINGNLARSGDQIYSCD